MNEPRTRKCGACQRKRPPKRQPAHMKGKLSFAEHLALNGGKNLCGICGNPPKPGGKALHRDHEHRLGGSPRGLLCFRCNAALRTYITLDWLRNAVAYLERFAN